MMRRIACWVIGTKHFAVIMWRPINIIAQCFTISVSLKHEFFPTILLGFG